MASLTHCISFVVLQGQWGVKAREDNLALECMGALWLQSSPRAPAPSPIVLHLLQLLHTALIPPLTTASTTRPTHRYCSATRATEMQRIRRWPYGCERYGIWTVGEIIGGWSDRCTMSAAVTEWAVSRGGREVEEMRMGMDIWTDRMREDLAESSVCLHLSLSLPLS